MDGFMHKWAMPHFDDFEILGVFESSHHKLYLPKEPNVVQAKVCLRMLLFGDFHRAQTV